MSNQDFQALDQTISFPAGQGTDQIELVNVTVFGNGPSSGNANFIVRLEVVSGELGPPEVAQSEVEVQILTCNTCQAYFANPLEVRFLKEVDDIQEIEVKRDPQAYGELVIRWTITPITGPSSFAMGYDQLRCADTPAFDCTAVCGGEQQCGFYGNAVFAPGEDTTSIFIRTVNDDVAELLQNGVLSLTHVLRGEGSINTQSDSVPIQILPSDVPFGSFHVEVSASTGDVIEEPGVASFNVIRTDGSRGAIQVGITTTIANAADKLFSSPIPNQLVAATQGSFIVNPSSNGGEPSADQCAIACFNAAMEGGSDCLSFSLQPAVGFPTGTLECHLSSSEAGVMSVGPENRHFVLNNTASRSYAKSGIDFRGVSAYLAFADGSRVEQVDIPIYGDVTPEVAETITLRIESIDFLNGVTRVGDQNFAGLNTSDWMTGIGNRASVIIAENDHPHGIFDFDAPKCPRSELTCFVAEEDTGLPQTNYSIDIIRQAGAFGEVNVRIFLSPQVEGPSAGIVVPIDQHVTFAEFETRKTVRLVSVMDDRIPEDDETVVVSIQPTNDPTVRRYLSLTIAASDDAFGVFELARRGPQATVTEGQSVAFSVTRRLGFFGDQLLRWRVIKGADQVVVSEGDLEFFDNVVDPTRNFTVEVAQDTIPELGENVTVTIFPVDCAAGRCGRINPDHSDASFHIADSDYPEGVFRFTKNVWHTEERDDVVELIIRRFGGNVGVRSVWYRTASGTANPFDYSEQPTPRELVWQPDDIEKTLRIVITDDAVSEPTEHFTVYLSDPLYANAAAQDGAEMYENYTEAATVIIGPSDDQGEYGEFSIMDGVITPEFEQGSPTGTYPLRILRSQGQYGRVNVSVTLSGIPPSTLFQRVGSGRPELPSTYSLGRTTTLSLNECAKACLGPDFEAEDPSFTENFLYNPVSTLCMPVIGPPLTTNDIVPSRDGEPWDHYTVNYSALESFAIPNVDFGSMVHFVVFESGQPNATVFVDAGLADDIAEADEHYHAALTRAQFVGSIPGDGPHAMQAPAVVKIPANDDWDGVFRLEANDDASPLILEEGTSGSFRVCRTVPPQRVTIPVNVSWAIVRILDDYDAWDMDFDVFSSSLSFDSGGCQTVTVSAQQDNVPERTEDFTVVLSANTGVTAISTAPSSQVRIQVPEGDFPAGALRLGDPSRVTLIEGDTYSNTIERTGSALYNVTVSWYLTSSQAGVNPANEFSVANGTVEFEADLASPSATQSRPFEFTALQDNALDIAQSFMLHLITQDPRVSNNVFPIPVTIAANGDQYRFSQQSARLDYGSSITLDIVRASLITNDPGGAVQVEWSSVGLPAAATPPSGVVTFDEITIDLASSSQGARVQSVTIALPDASQPVLSQTGVVYLTTAVETTTTDVGRSVSSNGVSILIPENSNPIGSYALEGGHPRTHEGETIILSIVQSRPAPNLGDVSVIVSCVGVDELGNTVPRPLGREFTLAPNQPDVILTSGGDLSVRIPGNRSLGVTQVALLVAQDSIDELEERFVFELTGDIETSFGLRSGAIRPGSGSVDITIAQNGFPRGTVSVTSIVTQGDTAVVEFSRSASAGNLTVSYIVEGHNVSTSDGYIEAAQPVDAETGVGTPLSVSIGHAIATGIPITEAVHSWSVEKAPPSLAGGEVLISTSSIDVVLSGTDFTHVQRLHETATSAHIINVAERWWYLFVCHSEHGLRILPFSDVSNSFESDSAEVYPNITCHSSVAAVTIGDSEYVVVPGGSQTHVLAWKSNPCCYANADCCLQNTSAVPGFVSVVGNLPPTTAVSPSRPGAIFASSDREVAVYTGSNTASGDIAWTKRESYLYSTAGNRRRSESTCARVTSLTTISGRRSSGTWGVLVAGIDCALALSDTLELVTDFASPNHHDYRLYSVIMSGLSAVLRVARRIDDDLYQDVAAYHYRPGAGQERYQEYAMIRAQPGRSAAYPMAVRGSVVLLEQGNFTLRSSPPTSMPTSAAPTQVPTFSQPTSSPTPARQCAGIGDICGGPDHTGPTQCIEGAFCAEYGSEEGLLNCQWLPTYHRSCSTGGLECGTDNGLACINGRCDSIRVCSAPPTSAPVHSQPTAAPTSLTAPPTATPTTASQFFCYQFRCARDCTGPNGIHRDVESGITCAWSSSRRSCVDVTSDPLTITTEDEMDQCADTSYSTSPSVAPSMAPTPIARIGFFTARELQAVFAPRDVSPNGGSMTFVDQQTEGTIYLTVYGQGLSPPLIPHRQKFFEVRLLSVDSSGGRLDPDPENRVKNHTIPGGYSGGSFGFELPDPYSDVNLREVHEPESINEYSRADTSISATVTRWSYAPLTDPQALYDCSVRWRLAGSRLDDVVEGGVSSGVITIPPHQMSAELVLPLARDDVPEFRSEYSLTLEADGPHCAAVQVGSDVYASRTVMQYVVAASDEPAGGIKFEASEYQLAQAPVDGETVTVTVNLSRSIDGYSTEPIYVAYVIHEGAYNTSQDTREQDSYGSEWLDPASYFGGAVNGFVVFPANNLLSPNQTIQFSLNFTGTDAPTAEMRFTVELVVATPAAAISFSQNTFDIVVPASSNAFGSIDIPSSSIIANNAARSLAFSVARSGGLFEAAAAPVYLEYAAPGDRFRGSSALFIGDVSQLEVQLPDGEAVQQFSLPLKTDIHLQLGGRFRISLGSPSPADTGVTLGLNNTSVASIGIEAANGVVRLISTTLMLYEAPASPTSASLQFERIDGTFGAATVNLTIAGPTGNTATDQLQYPEQVVVLSGESAASAIISVRADDIAEMRSRFNVSLESAASNTAVGNSTALVVIAGSDQPHGEAGFATGIDAVQFVSNFTHRGLDICFERTGNAQGNATIPYRISASDGSRNRLLLVASIELPSGQSGMVCTHSPFTPNYAAIVGTTYTVTLDGDRPIVADMDSDSPISWIQGVTTSRSEAVVFDIHTYGVMSFHFAAPAVREGQPAMVVIERNFSNILKAVVVTLQPGPGTAVPGLDYVPDALSVRFSDGQRSAVVSIGTLDDEEAETDESFDVMLISETGAVVDESSATQTEFILANDGIYGVVGFNMREAATRTVAEPTSGELPLTFQVTREPRGTPASIRWSAEGDDVSVAGGTLVFDIFTETLAINLAIPPDETPEGDKIIVITLARTDELDDSVIVGGLTMLRVIVAANDHITVVPRRSASITAERSLQYDISPVTGEQFNVRYELSWGESDPTIVPASDCADMAALDQARGGGHAWVVPSRQIVGSLW